MGQTNIDIRDLSYRMQGRRIAYALWIAGKVEQIYAEQWAVWLRRPSNADPLLLAPSLAESFIRREVITASRSFWLEGWEGMIRAVPRPIIEALGDRRDRLEATEAEHDDEDERPGEQDDTNAKAPSKVAPPRSSPIQFAAALYLPPTVKQIEATLDASGWFKELTGLAGARRIQRIVKAGVSAGTPTPDIARAIRGIYQTDKRGAAGKGTRNRAMRIARTEIHRVTQRVQEDSFTKAAGEMLRGYRYVATLDSRTRANHAERDGNVYELKDRRPILPDGPNCRCTYAPATKSWKDLGIPELGEALTSSQRASADGALPRHTVYSSWFDGQSGQTQRNIVGAGRFDRLRGKRSKITWKQFASAPKSPARKPAIRTQRGRRVAKA